MTDKKRIELLHEKAARLNEIISGLVKEIERVRKKRDEAYAFSSHVKYFSAKVMPYPNIENEVEFFEDPSLRSDVIRDTLKGYEEEEKQLFELYQKAVKELNDTWEEEQRIRKENK